jgi:hypothetical protein
MLDNPAARAALPAGQPSRKHRHAVKWEVFLALVLVALIVGVYYAASGSGSSGAAASKVQTCSGAHYVQAAASCSVPDNTISAAEWPGARLAFSSKGDTFSSTALHITVSQLRSDGSSVTLGVADRNDMTLSDGTAAVYLSYVFDTAGASPAKGQAYSIEVDNGGTLLGDVSFTYTG